jgi:signal peptidase I
VQALIKGLAWIVLFFVASALIGRIFFFEVATTHSYSMVPNLIAGDTFLVFNKGTLGPGDLAMCKDPENPGMMIVLRILGVPGSTFEMKNNVLVLNDAPIAHEQAGPELVYEDNTGGENEEFVVGTATEKAAGHVYEVAMMNRAGDKDFAKTEVEEGFFLVGDNRNRSRDSRDFGEIPIGDCVGNPFLIIRPGPNSGDFKFRNRFLSWVE